VSKEERLAANVESVEVVEARACEETRREGMLFMMDILVHEMIKCKN
jgi:hypothetical protein